jgi:putative ABC transport system substrate-binding protein
MKRREFIAGTTALLVSQRLRAEGTPRRIGFFGFLDPIAREAWRTGLRERGWIEGRNLLIEYRYAETPDRMPTLAAELVALTPNLVPGASKIAILVNPDNPIHRLLLAEEVPSTARKLGVALPIVEATTAEELDIAFASAAAQRADAMIVFGDYLTIRQGPRVIALAAEHHLPAIYLFRQFANGGLVVYGPDIADLFRRAGGYVDKILKGAKPSDLPVEQPTKFELVINMKTAKALGLTVPPLLLVRADEVIE